MVRERCPTTKHRDAAVQRYYDPGTGQFMSLDPLNEMTNAGYTFNNDNPFGGGDPTGTIECGAGPYCSSGAEGPTPASGPGVRQPTGNGPPLVVPGPTNQPRQRTPSQILGSVTMAFAAFLNVLNHGGAAGEPVPPPPVGVEQPPGPTQGKRGRVQVPLNEGNLQPRNQSFACGNIWNPSLPGPPPASLLPACPALVTTPGAPVAWNFSPPQVPPGEVILFDGGTAVSIGGILIIALFAFR
jgi:hypothetical protein